MEHLPILVNLKGKHCLIVGGGEAAANKADLFIRAGAILTVIAPHMSDAMRQHLSAGHIVWDIEQFSAEAMSHVPRPCLVVSVAENASINRAVARYCQQHHIPVSLLGEREQSDFLFFNED
ncbi:MAG: NAD(P)-dependent oxidoreductase [Thiomicrorhabdus chilensis]|uniref:precorrin-2 dehydrogenase/sirohydrochlorin ferrochelatase family protein n=1 Tax=Thiomicrorhabdus chilensis TaxID=63656 RepID=UPI00299E12E5|nr:NAD(P)-dependent oxidoreductase [Thiomicrorhabdus chilensis]MDX1346827.1 NAD(P)-dependent oxidoreductase [Thiomicrorhabdus chilensis]